MYFKDMIAGSIAGLELLNNIMTRYYSFNNLDRFLFNNSCYGKNIGDMDSEIIMGMILAVKEDYTNESPDNKQEYLDVVKEKICNCFNIDIERSLDISKSMEEDKGECPISSEYFIIPLGNLESGLCKVVDLFEYIKWILDKENDALCWPDNVSLETASLKAFTLDDYKDNINQPERRAMSF